MSYSKKVYSLILAFVFVACLSFISGYYLGKSDSKSFVTRQDLPVTTISTPTLVPDKNNIATKKCSPYGVLSKEEYLISYTVKRGDAIFSILNKESYGTAKVTEFIEINNDVYPGLSLQNPFIEVGWKLYLPPKYGLAGSGKYEGLQGEILDIDGAYITVNQKPDEVVPVRIKLGAFTQYVPSDYRFNKGDCVRVVYDADKENLAVSVVAE